MKARDKRRRRRVPPVLVCSSWELDARTHALLAAHRLGVEHGLW